jgi:hypothetical protein
VSGAELCAGTGNVIRDEKRGRTDGEWRDVEALLERIETRAQRFEGLDRVYFYARIAKSLKDLCGSGGFEELLVNASEAAEQQRAAWQLPFDFAHYVPVARFRFSVKTAKLRF